MPVYQGQGKPRRQNSGTRGKALAFKAFKGLKRVWKKNKLHAKWTRVRARAIQFRVFILLFFPATGTARQVA